MSVSVPLSAVSLSVVPPLDDRDTVTSLPTFEGEQVDIVRAKLTCTAGLEMGDDAHRIDDIAQLLVSARVVRVDHVVEARSGRLVRVETFKIIEATEMVFTSDFGGAE